MIGVRIAPFVCLLGLSTAGCLPALAQHPPAHEIVLYDDDGTLSQRLSYSKPIHVVERNRDTMLLSNGDVLNRNGSRWTQALRFPDDETRMPAAESSLGDPWSDPVYLAPDDAIFTGPVLDALGTMWIVLDSVNGVELAHSTGADDPWELIPVPDVLGPGRIYPFTVDNDGVVTMVSREITQGLYELLTVRYTPGVGWGQVEVIESTEQFFQTLRLTTDDRGNVIVFYDRHPDGAFGSAQPWSVSYDGATGQWGTPEPIAPATISPYAPALLRTPSGDVVRVIYFNSGPPGGGSDTGIFIQTWDGTAKSWSAPQKLPGSRWLFWDSSGGSFPAGMDEEGNVLAAWSIGIGPFSSVVGSRYADGSWKRSVLLVPWSFPYVGLHNGFSDAAATPTGDFMAVQTAYVLGFRVRLFVFHYDKEQGWRPTASPFMYGNAPMTRSRVAWYGDGKAVATVADYDSSQLTSVFYNGTSWDGTTAAVDPLAVAVFQELLSSGDSVLAVWERLAGETGIVTRWLQP